MQELFNRKSYLTFKQRAASAGVTEVHVQRREAQGEVTFAYNARESRSKRILQGTWRIARNAEAASKEEAFLAMVAADFAIRRHDADRASASADGAPAEGASGQGAEADKATQE